MEFQKGKSTGISSIFDCKMARFLLISFFLLSVALSEFIFEYTPIVSLIVQRIESTDGGYVEADARCENVGSGFLVHK